MAHEKFAWKGHEFVFISETPDGTEWVRVDIGELHHMLSFIQKVEPRSGIHGKYAAADRILEMRDQWVKDWEAKNGPCPPVPEKVKA